SARTDAEAEGALLRAADAIEAAVAERHHRAAALVEQPVDAGDVRALLREPLRAVLPARLLVDDGDELHLAAGRAPAAAREARERDGLRGGLRLHVDRAAAPDRAVVDLARPRVVAPVGRVGEHRVDVGEVAQHRPLGLARQA